MFVAAKLLQRPASRFWNQKGSEETAEHEESKYLHDVCNPRSAVSGVCLCQLWIGSNCSQRTKHALSDNRTDFTGRCRDTVGSRSIASREYLAGDNEGGGVGSRIEEELGQRVQCHQSSAGQIPKVKTNNTEQQCQHEEPKPLDGLAADSINQAGGDPVSGNSTGKDEDEVAHSSVVVDQVHVATTTPADGIENNRVVQTQTIKGNIL